MLNDAPKLDNATFFVRLILAAVFRSRPKHFADKRTSGDDKEPP